MCHCLSLPHYAPVRGVIISPSVSPFSLSSSNAMVNDSGNKYTQASY